MVVAKTKRKPKIAPAASKRKPKTSERPGYGSFRESQARISRERSETGREIGPLPKITNRRRRKRTEASLFAFLDTYFPGTFALAWSDDQRAAIEDTQRVIESGGLLAVAEPRGNGKTARTVRAAMWAVLTGRRRFVVVIAAEQGLADSLIAIMRTELQFNDLLAADYPEACYPIRRLENITKRQSGQTLAGRPTLIKLTSDELVLPTVVGAKSSGAIIRAVGLTGAVRGQIATTGDGRTVRPDLVMLDDAQTRESAKSPTQTSYREALVNGDVLGLAGPGQTIACVNLCTVIYPNDLSERFLDREKNPTWNGRRAKLLTSSPTNLDLWDQYAELRRASLREYGDNRRGAEFYTANRVAMDAGGVASWPARHPGCISAIQYAMDLRIDRPAAFKAEYQNEPEEESLGAVKELDARAIAEKVTGLDRGTVPREATRLTAFIDVGGSVLWWTACGWDERFSGWVVDYGTWPRQNRTYFAASDARPSLADHYPGLSESQRVWAGLRDLTADLLGRRFPRADSPEGMPLDRLLIDSGWLADVVFAFIGQTDQRHRIHASKGYAASSSNARPMSEWQVRPGERVGLNWRLGAPERGKGQLAVFDPDFWKSWTADRLLTPPGGPGCLTLPKGDHTLFADHVTAEYATRVSARGRTFDKWQMRPDRTDNHWLDCLVGCAVGASIQGLQWSASGSPIASAAGKPLDIAAMRRKAIEDQRRGKRP